MKGIVQNNPANDPDKKPFKSRSRFKPNVSVFQTARFGENTPFYAAEVVPDDQNFSLRVNSDVDTLTLKSPLMSPLRMNKDYFFVPLRAILPNNSDRLVTNPLTGDDVIAGNVNATIVNSALIRIAGVVNGSGSGSTSSTQTHWDSLRTLGQTEGTSATVSTLASFIGYALWNYRVGWYLFSEGSLLRNLGYNTHTWFTGPQRNSDLQFYSFDEWYEAIFSWLNSCVQSFSLTLATGMIGGSTGYRGTVTTQTYTVYPNLSSIVSYQGDVLNLRGLLFLLQQGAVPVTVSSVVLNSGRSLDNIFPVFSIDGTPLLDVDSASDFWNIRCAIWKSLQHSTTVPVATVDQISSGGGSYNGARFINLSRAVAYQLACMQFYTNDSVDYIYNCNLWHENMKSLFHGMNGTVFPKYVYNGMSLDYDSISGYVLDYVSQQLNFQSTRFVISDSSWSLNYSLYPQIPIALFYFGNILGFNRSLRFRDYFVGSKTSPLAVGNVDVTVTSGQFSVVDVTKNIMIQRFLNQVNRVGRSLKEYSRGIFGANPSYDPHECVFLGSTTDIIGAEETQNTGSQQREQFSITSRMRSESSKFAFEGSFQEFGIVLGILSFDVARPYTQNSDRALYHVDRFDMFNPYLQTIGDQAVHGCEINGQQNITNVGYQMRYMEYRQRSDFATGGFLHFLPAYCFLADYRTLVQYGHFDIYISPDFIRSRSYEFDDLYQVLTNVTPAGYFHFIIRHDCEVQVDRPMLAAPTIL